MDHPEKLKFLESGMIGCSFCSLAQGRLAIVFFSILNRSLQYSAFLFSCEENIRNSAALLKKSLRPL